MGTDAGKLWRMSLVLTAVVVACPGTPSQAQGPKAGLEVGDKVPIASMRCVVGQPTDKNTCLAGKYRDRRTVSVYVRSTEEPNLDALLKGLEALLADNKEVRGYVLLLQGSQFDEALKGRLRDWARGLNLTRVDVAITNGDPARTYGVTKGSAVVVVYSDKLMVKHHRAFEAGKLDGRAVKEVGDRLKELSR